MHLNILNSRFVVHAGYNITTLVLITKSYFNAGCVFLNLVLGETPNFSFESHVEKVHESLLWFHERIVFNFFLILKFL